MSEKHVHRYGTWRAQATACGDKIAALVRIAYVVLHGLALTLWIREEVLIELKQVIAEMVR